MWLPTSSTLQQLAWVTLARRDSPAPGAGAARIGRRRDDRPDGDPDRHAGRWRRRGPAGLRVPRRPTAGSCSSTPAIRRALRSRRALELVRAAGGRLEAIALTHADPDHAAGAENLVASRLGIPVVAGPGAGRSVALRGSRARRPRRRPRSGCRDPGGAHSRARPEHLAFIVGDARFVVTGDLDGVRGARTLPGPTDEAAWAASRERLARLAPNAMHLHGHPRAGHGAAR